MPMNAALEGKSYPSVLFRVDADHVARFAAAVGEDGASVPPTFVTAPEIAAGLAQVVADAELGLDFSRVVHGEQEYVWQRPVRVGETLEVRSTIESIRAKGRHEFLTLRTAMLDEDGAEVVSARSSLVVRGAS
jgi:acyl dehydratase